jgi:hypothetical protein
MAHAKKTVAATDKAESQQDAEKRLPVWSFRQDDVSVSVWKREFKGREFYSCSFERSYKDNNGQWKYTRSFGMDDLGKLVTCVKAASDYLLGLQHKEEPVK